MDQKNRESRQTDSGPAQPPASDMTWNKTLSLSDPQFSYL